MMKTEAVPGNLHKESIQWSCEHLRSLGYTLKNNIPKNVTNTPWSYVVCFETSDGYIYLKHMPKLISLEASIIDILSNKFHAAVPTVISENTELNCFLMKDAGRPLREILKHKFDVTLLCKAIEQFTALQLAVADHLDVFIEIGVPDWRLIKNACLKNYIPTSNKKQLLDAFETAHVLWFAYGLLAHDRLIQACGEDTLKLFQYSKLGILSKELLALLKNGPL